MAKNYEKVISERTAKVLVFSPSEPAYGELLCSVLNSLGFKQIQQVYDSDSALAVCASKPIDWLLAACPSKSSDHLLQICREIVLQPHYGAPMMSVCIAAEEQHHVPAAFELGLLSWHPISDQKAVLTEELKELFTTLTKNAGNEIKTAAVYLRKLLVEQRFYDSLLSLEQSLYKALAGDGGVLLALAEAQLLSGQLEKGWQTLNQVELVDEDLKQAIYAVRKRYNKKIETVEGDQEAKARPINLDKGLIIDSDLTVQSQIGELLKIAGIKDVQLCASTEEAETWLKTNPEPDLIILEWRTPKINGPAIVQKVRFGGHKRTIIGVVSSQVKTNDLPLLREMGVDLIIEKPVDRKDFLKKLVWAVGQDKVPMELGSMYRKINHHLVAGEELEARQLVGKFKNHKSCLDGDKSLVDALSAFFSEDYKGAQELAQASLSNCHDKVAGLTILGKSLLKLGNFTDSLKVFEMAQTLSPMNIDRACQIAKLSYETNDKERAEVALAGAKAIDAKSAIIAKTEASIAIEEQDFARAKDALGKLDSLKQLIADMNNRGIALTRNGSIDEAVALYQATIKAIGPNDSDRNTVCYNLALAYARSDKLKLAKDILVSIVIAADGPLGKKTSSLLERISDSLNGGAQFSLTASPNLANIVILGGLDDGTAQVKEETKKQVIMSGLSCHCLYQVFKIAPTEAKKMGSEK